MIKNKANRSGTGQLVHHHAGSKSAYKHRQQMVKNLGKDVSYEELYLHIKLPREKGSQGNGVQGNQQGTTNNEFADAVSPQQNHEGSTVDSMNFPDKRSREVYEHVLRLRANLDNTGKPDEQLFLMASGRKSHGRVYGLGSTVNPSLLKSANSRSKSSQYATVVTSEDNSEVTYTVGQVKAIMEEHTRRRNQEELARHNQHMFYIQKLFELTGNQIPELPQVATTGVPTNEGWNGNIEEDNTVLSNHVPPTNVTESENLYIDSFFGAVEFQSNLAL